MQTDHNANGGRRASRSRREFLQSALAAASSAGIAATLPAVAEAGGSANLPTLQLTDEQQLKACIGQLRDILQRMHPGFDDVRGGYFWHEKVFGPREVIDPDRIIRKVKGGAL